MLESNGFVVYTNVLSTISSFSETEKILRIMGVIHSILKIKIKNEPNRKETN
jgi:hypothetical protein